MSSDFAEFLFSFACNKLESSPQLDLRQQLLHSNLIRYILLVHQPSTSTPSSTPSTPPSASPAPLNHPPLLSLPPLPPSPPASPAPQSLSHQFQQSHSHSPQPFDHYTSTPTPTLISVLPSQDSSNWSPFSFIDELDRIPQDQDVDMGDDLSESLFLPTSPMFLDDSSLHEEDGFSFPPYHAGPRLQGMFDDVDEFESSQAQEDWLDAILEDLMEEDDDDQEDSSTEYDSEEDEDDNHTFDRQQNAQDVEINVTRATAAPSVVVVGSGNTRKGLTSSSTSSPHDQGQGQYQPHHFHSTTPCSPPPPPHPYESPHHPYHPPYLHQSSSPSKDKGSTTIVTAAADSNNNNNIAPSASSRIRPVKGVKGVVGVDVDESMDPCDITQLKLQRLSSFFYDYRPCPPCLGFHTSPSESEEALREQRFVLLTQELGSTMLQEQESSLTTPVVSTEQHGPPAGGQIPLIGLGH